MTKPVFIKSTFPALQDERVDALHLLSTQWLERLDEFEQLIVAFSGGLDSTVLLSCLASYPFLHSRLLAIHINHGISPNALAWQKHCEAFCSRLNVSFLTESIAFNRSSNIEEEARTARYAAFARILNRKSCLLLGHHMDDQAETVLLQLFRGTGVDGLAGIPVYENFASGTIARPLLQHTREQLHHYAQVAQLTWIDDESNLDSRFSRNYLRNQIMPLLREKWPGVVGNINRTAVHCQQGKKNLYQLALIDCQELEHPGKSLSIEPLKHLGEARIINVLRVWLKKNKIKLPTTAVMSRIVHELLEASIDATPLVAWNDICIRRYQGRIYLDNKRLHPLPECLEWSAFPQSLALNDESILFAKAAKEGLIIPPKAKITIRFRQGGETIVLHQQTKKLKKLFQEWQVPVWLRERIPLLYINEQLAAVVGYVVSDSFFSSTEPAWIINF